MGEAPGQGKTCHGVAARPCLSTPKRFCVAQGPAVGWQALCSLGLWLQGSLCSPSLRTPATGMTASCHLCLVILFLCVSHARRKNATGAEIWPASPAWCYGFDAAHRVLWSPKGCLLGQSPWVGGSSGPSSHGPYLGERLLERQVSLQEGSLGQSRGGEVARKGREHPQSCGRKLSLGISRRPLGNLLQLRVEDTREGPALSLGAVGSV